MFAYMYSSWICICCLPNTKAMRCSPSSQTCLKRLPLRQPWFLDQPSCSTLRAALVFTFHADLGSACSKPSAALEASKEARGELTPWPSRWSSGWGRKSHRHPWHSPRTRVRDGSQDAPHTHTHTPHQQTPPQTHTDLMQNHTQPGTTIKSVRELKAKTPTDIPQHLSNKDNHFFCTFWLTMPVRSSNRMAPKLHQSHAAVSSLIPPTSEKKSKNTGLIGELTSREIAYVLGKIIGKNNQLVMDEDKKIIKCA